MRCATSIKFRSNLIQIYNKYTIMQHIFSLWCLQNIKFQEWTPTSLILIWKWRPIAFPNRHGHRRSVVQSMLLFCPLWSLYDEVVEMIPYCSPCAPQNPPLSRCGIEFLVFINIYPLKRTKSSSNKRIMQTNHHKYYYTDTLQTNRITENYFIICLVHT